MPNANGRLGDGANCIDAWTARESLFPLVASSAQHASHLAPKVETAKRPSRVPDYRRGVGADLREGA